jgi:hypothetical protein
VTRAGDVCEKCRREESESGQSGLPTYDGAPYYESIEEGLRHWLGVGRLQLFDSRAAKELERLLKNFILGLCVEDGPYWEAVRDLRTRWCISPQVGIPPQDWHTYFHPPGTSEESTVEERMELSAQWEKDLRAIRDRFIPDRFKARQEHQRRWRDFISRCALFQPPGDDLFGFYLSCGAGPWLDLPEGWEDAGDQELVAMTEAPIERLRDTDRVETAWKEYYETLIKELGERYLRPAGIDVGEAISDVLESNSVLEERLGEKLQEIEDDRLPYIRPDQYTTKDDVVHAFQLLARSQEKRPKTGRGQRDRLIAVQYAILHYEYGWTFRQIAERYEGRTDEQFLERLEDHAAVGREILVRSRAKNSS